VSIWLRKEHLDRLMLAEREVFQALVPTQVMCNGEYLSAPCCVERDGGFGTGQAFGRDRPFAPE
jgi:hypothetical protein